MTVYGPCCVSYVTVWRWKKKFESGVGSIKNAPKSGRPKSASRKEIVSKIKEIIEGDASFTVRDMELFKIYFYFTAACVVPCGSRKKPPCTSSIVQIIFYFSPLRSEDIF